MNSRSYLTFRSHNLSYGIEISLVKEIFQLPELTIIPETPGDVIGVLYLRDRTIPVMHLDRRLGQPVGECHLSDRVIVVQWETVEMGIIVDEVLDVVEIDRNSMELEPDYGHLSESHTAFVANVARMKDSHLILLNTEALIREPEAVSKVIADVEAEDSQVSVLSTFFDTYCSQATARERAIFSQRAKELAIPVITERVTGTMPMAIFSLDKEYFGCDLSVVKEFIDIDKITPIPCSPSHIVGNINLRGEIVTLVDIRSLIKHSAVAGEMGTQAIVVQIEDIHAGIVVDEVFDVFKLNRQELMEVPVGISGDIRQYFYGMTTYNDNLLSAIDLPKIFTEGNLVTA